MAFERALGTEAALRHETRLRAVVEASPVALIGLQADNTVTMANRAALELLGWGTDEAEWLPPEGLQEPLAELTETVLSTGSVVNLPVSFDSRNLSLSGAPMPAISADDKLSVLVAGVDLSEIRRAEFALVQAQRLEAMGQVAGRVAHDFNNLLTLIIGYAELLRRGTVDVKQQTLIDNIEGASRRAAALTQQMLDMTRQKVDSGVVIDLGREVEGLDQVLARMSGPKVNLKIRSSQNIIKVRLDPSEMEQIVVNLVINACDAMDGVGSVNVSVQMDVPTPEDRRLLDLPSGPLALLRVADDGPGMSADVRERCLEPFFTTKERGQGSGLGLPTVYGLVKERGGQLRIDSEPGQGTMIRIWLPVARDAMLSTGSEGGEFWPPGQDDQRADPAGRGRPGPQGHGRRDPHRHRPGGDQHRLGRVGARPPGHRRALRHPRYRHHAAGHLGHRAGGQGPGVRTGPPGPLHDRALRCHRAPVAPPGRPGPTQALPARRPPLASGRAHRLAGV